LIFQNKQINWFDSKVNQSQTVSNPFKKPLSVKQPVEMIIQQVDFPLLFQNTFFFKRIKFKHLWIKSMSGLHIQTTQNPHTQATTKPSTNLHGFGAIKVYLQQTTMSSSSSSNFPESMTLLKREDRNEHKLVMVCLNCFDKIPQIATDNNCCIKM